MYLSKKIKISILLVSITIISLIVLIGFTKDKLPFELGLSQSQRLIDYAYNEQWLYAIIENKDNHKVDLAIYRLEETNHATNLEKVSEYDFTLVSPWKIEIGNIDYTGGPQIIMGVNKATHFDKEENNRVFVFNWDGEKLYKKWTGTRLGYYLKDFYVMDLLDIKGDEIVVIDKNKEGKERVLVYYWFDFGFQLLAEGKFYDNIEELKYIDKNLLEIAYSDQGEKAKIMIKVNNGYIIEVK